MPAPQKLPADFSDWDAAPPERLPADFSEWDQAPPRAAAAPAAAPARPRDPRAKIADAAGGFLKGAIGDTIKGVVDAGVAFMGTPTSGFELAMGPVGAVVKGARVFGPGILRGHANELGQASQAASQGDWTSAIGHGVYGAIPVVGPAAGEALGQVFNDQASPADRWRAGGQLAAMAFGPKVAKGAARAVAKSAPQMAAKATELGGAAANAVKNNKMDIAMGVASLLTGGKTKLLSKAAQYALEGLTEETLAKYPALVKDTRAALSRGKVPQAESVIQRLAAIQEEIFAMRDAARPTPPAIPQQSAPVAAPALAGPARVAARVAAPIEPTLPAPQAAEMPTPRSSPLQGLAPEIVDAIMARRSGRTAPPALPAPQAVAESVAATRPPAYSPNDLKQAIEGLGTRRLGESQPKSPAKVTEMPKSTAATSFEDWARHNKAVEIVTVLKQAGAGPDMAAAIGPEQIKLAAQAARIEGFSDATAKLVKDMLAGKVSSAKMAKPQPVKLTGTEDLEGALSESLKWIEARKAKN